MESQQPARSTHRSAAQRTVDIFTYEAALLFFRMRLAATEYVGQGKHSAGRRSILKELGDRGPQTVPEMARKRSVSRQHIQKLVNELRSGGYVHPVSNPAHKRSRLIALTSRGEDALNDLYQREDRLLTFLARGLPLSQIRTATEVVRKVRENLESEEWQELTRGEPTCAVPRETL